METPVLTSVLMTYGGGTGWRGGDTEVDSLLQPSRNVYVNLQSAVKA